MEKLFTELCHFIGFRLFTLGAQLLSYRVFAMYQPEGDPYVRAMHVAWSETDLNNSMRTYVEELDKTYTPNERN
jgi:hypothetical protein